MANYLSVGESYRAIAVHSGENSKGPWEMIVTKDDRNKCEIIVWVNNKPCNVPNGGTFKIKEITKAGWRWKSEEKDGKTIWNAKVSIEASVINVESGFENIPDGNSGLYDGFPEDCDGDLPF